MAANIVGKGNPPAGVDTLLFSKDVNWIESETVFLENKRLLLQAQQSDTISMVTLQEHRAFYYDVYQHQFFPLQWLLRRDWILQYEVVEEVCPNQSALLSQWGIEASTDPILSTRFAHGFENVPVRTCWILTCTHTLRCTKIVAFLSCRNCL